MAHSVSYFKEVQSDIINAKAWYKEQQPGLEKRFAESIKTAILKLQENPLAFAIRYKNIRIAHPKHFHTEFIIISMTAKIKLSLSPSFTTKDIRMFLKRECDHFASL